MTTTKLVLRTNKTRRDGTAPVYLRITSNRRSRFVKTGVTLIPTDWNPDREEVRKSHPAYKTLTDELHEFRDSAASTARAQARKGGGSALAVKREVQGRGSTEFVPFAENYAEAWVLKGKHSQSQKVHVTLNKLKAFAPSGLTFPDLDRHFLDRFSAFMATKYGNVRSTQQKNLQILRSIVKQAVLDEVISQADDPFVYYTIGSSKGNREHLPYPEVLALAALDLPTGSRLDLTRDAFLFSFYASGMRFGDLCALTWKAVTDTHVQYQTMKTGKVKSVKLTAPARAILAKYRLASPDFSELVFPILARRRDYSDPSFVRKKISSKNVGVNEDLKVLAKMIRTRVHLTFHVARHSFATHGLQVSGNIDAVREALGHSKIGTTQIYVAGASIGAEDALLDQMFSG